MAAVAKGMANEDANPLSPTALAVTRDGKTVFVCCATKNRVLQLNGSTCRIEASLMVPGCPSGITLSPDESQMFVTCAKPESEICVVDRRTLVITDRIKGGHTAMSPVVSLDGKTLFVCNRFNNEIEIIDLRNKKDVTRISVEREPVAAVLTGNGKHLLVANLLPTGRADVDAVSCAVSVIDVGCGMVSKTIRLPSGAGLLMDIGISPDGRYAVVSHILSRFHLPAHQIERGWINANALTIIDLSRMELLNTLLLDEPEKGAANPWGICWSGDGRTLVVTHAGTHEISIIDFPGLISKLEKLPVTLGTTNVVNYGISARVQSDVPNDLRFLSGLRKRIKLPASDLGPRFVTAHGTTVYAANYFSDTISLIDLSTAEPKTESIALGPQGKPSIIRQGEFYFHDAGICHQGWQSCSSCHPGEGRADGLNWDLLNDGIGNPKNTKSLLLAHKTPPAMSLGVRGTAEIAVLAGIRHILFAEQPDEVATAIDEYLKSLKPVPSPYLVGGKLSQSARRGKRLFTQAGCAICHPPDLFTDLHSYDVGTQGKFDQATDKFDSPTLIELWRTSPYLHDGSAATVRDVIKNGNITGKHGKTSRLSERDVDDLCAYLLSL